MTALIQTHAHDLRGSRFSSHSGIAGKTFLVAAVLFGSLALLFSADKAREAQADDIREAVFRWQFSHNGSAQQKEAGAYYLGIGARRHDPAEPFLMRFAGHSPPVRKVSACNSDPRKGVLDKGRGTAGLIFYITTIEWKSDTEVEVQGGFYEARLSASANTYTLKKEDGKWRVTHDKVHWIS